MLTLCCGSKMPQSLELIAMLVCVTSLADNTNETLHELLARADIYLTITSALQVSTKSSVVILKLKPSEHHINNYNASVMLARQANMDIQYVLNAYAGVTYVASYIMISARSTGEFLNMLNLKP